ANEDWATKARRFLEKCGADGALDLADECPHTFAWDSVPKVQDQRSIDVAAQSLYDDAYREITRLKESISDAHDMARAAR
ncbi:MAG TPA: hypothetical protein DCE44_13785, partial [Verrucomicrobiales bacterium]|nr:hypothetical protein [Verrucomicrobiales bacterium]